MTPSPAPEAPRGEPGVFSDEAVLEAKIAALVAVEAADPNPERHQPGNGTYRWWEVLAAVELSAHAALGAPRVRAEVEAQRRDGYDSAMEVMGPEVADLSAERDRLAAALAEARERIAAVEALHVKHRVEETAVYVDMCSHCADYWPCPTAAALAGDGQPPRPVDPFAGYAFFEGVGMVPVDPPGAEEPSP